MAESREWPTGRFPRVGDSREWPSGRGTEWASGRDLPEVARDLPEVAMGTRTGVKITRLLKSYMESS